MKPSTPVQNDLTRTWQNSIAVKIAAVVLYALVLVAYVVAAVWLWNADERLEREFAEKADRLAYTAAVEAGGGEGTAAELLVNVERLLPEFGFSGAEVTMGSETLRSGDLKNDPSPIVRTIPSGGESPHTIRLYHTPLRELVRSRRNMVFLVTGASALAFGLFLTWVILKFITRPVNALVAATRAVTSGDLSVRLDTDRQDEFGVLSHFFNRMLERIDDELAERKRAEEQLRSSHEFLRTVLDSLNDEVMIVDVNDFKIVDANAAFVREYGYTPKDVVNKTCHKITHKRADVCAPPDDICPLLETVKSGRFAAAEHVHYDRNGGKIYAEVSSSPIRDKDGRIVRVVHVSRDITERKKSEQALKESEERSHRLNEQLSQSNKDLQEVNEELKSFAYIVSHDLRAPLVNIRGFSEELVRAITDLGPLLEKHLDEYPEKEKKKFSEALKQDIPEALKFIGSSVGRMDNLISAILNLSRAGRRTLNPEPLRMNDVVRGILDTLAHQIESRGATVRVGELTDLVADRTAVEQIFGNLLDNAVKYLDPARPGKIEIKEERSEREIVFQVRDNGRGIAAEDIPKAFEIFRRIGRQDVPGEGMGLAYVRALVRHLGGRIWCDSNPGEGTTFSFSLPVPAGIPRAQGDGGGRS